MKRIVLISVLVLNVLLTFADGLTVTSFTKSVTDLSARTKPRLDNNGKHCSLIKVLFAGGGLQFDGNVIGNVRYESESSTYWVYVSEEADLIVVSPSNGDPLIVNFDDFDEIKKLESNTTYMLQLQLDKYDYRTVYAPNHSGVLDGHQYVDLGLSVMWATCNLNAQAPEDGGKRYAWGETISKSSFTDDNYKYKGSWSDEWNEWIFSKYNDFNGEDYLSLLPSDDAAHVIWGDSWRMPTMDEMIELYNSCTFIMTTYKNTNGYIVTGPSGNSMFLPMVDYGKRIPINVPDHSEETMSVSAVSYMTSTLDMPLDPPANSVVITLGKDVKRIEISARSDGYYVRPVCKKK